MAIKIQFDQNYNAEQPTFVLTTRSGKKLGKLPISNLQFTETLNSHSEARFDVYKVDVKSRILWDQIVDLKLIWAKEWNALFEIRVETDDGDGIVKRVTAISLGESELSQINLYTIEINTETDIEREDYKPTVLFNEQDASASLLNRIMEKAPHYIVKHVDASIAGIQRTFTFDNTTLYDAFMEISEEIDCMFVPYCYLDDDGKVVREINVYDLESYCNECGHRGDFLDECDHCGSTNITTGYGEDTTIYVSSENLGEDITFTTDVDSVKNCFKLEAGDDLMTSAIRDCNPNGSSYMWYISDALKEDMSDELAAKITSYDADYDYYQKEYVAQLDHDLILRYNALINKYKDQSDKYTLLSDDITGYPALMQVYYDTIDFYLYLNNSLMPKVEITRTSAGLQGMKLSHANLSPVAVQDISSCSATTANNAVLQMAKSIIDPNYKVTIKDSSYADATWTGTFVVTSYGDENDTYTSRPVSITVNDNYEIYVKQRIDKLLSNKSEDVTDITSLFKLDNQAFADELKKYSLSYLSIVQQACQSCVDILIEQGIADRQTWANTDPDLYLELYLPYYQKLGLIEKEIKTRESEIALITEEVQPAIEAIRNSIQDKLNFEKYIGEDLWMEFIAYRREDTYSNSNYISDGLDNAALFSNALEFVETAQKDIYKSAVLQHSISATLKNLLVIKEFAPIVTYFAIGNWIRVRVDENVYKLRLIEYTIDYENLGTLSIEFSDVKETSSGLSDVESILKNASSMSSSYSAVTRQATKGSEAKAQINDWLNNSLAATTLKIVNNAESQDVTWGENGLLCRQYLPITDSYDPCQLKIINKGLYITDDNWATSKAGIGNFTLLNPLTGQVEDRYGIIADTVVGRVVLSENTYVVNDNNSFKMDENGFVITNGTNTFTVNPNDEAMVRVTKNSGLLFGLNTNGDLTLTGDVNATSGRFGRSYPFILSDNGFDGTSVSDTASETLQYDNNFDLYNSSNSTYLDEFTIQIVKENATDNSTDIVLNLLSVNLNIQYSYVVTRTETITHVVDGSGDDDDTSTTTTETVTYNETVTDSVNVPIVSARTDVTNQVTVELAGDVKTYYYTYDFNKSDMATYLKTFVKNNDPNVSSYDIADITLLGAVSGVSAEYYFPTYTTYAHIGTDYLNYNNDLIVSGGRVTMSVATISTLDVAGNITLTGQNQQISGNMATNDYWRLLGGGSNDGGYLEIATSDNGNEPVYVRQYQGKFGTITRSLTLLDGAGNTRLPGTLFTGSISSTGSFINMNSETVFYGENTWIGSVNSPRERRLRFSNMNGGGTYKHNAALYGGNSESTIAIGMWDTRNNAAILRYRDTDRRLYLNGPASVIIKTFAGDSVGVVGSNNTNTMRVSHFASHATTLAIKAQWDTNSFSTKQMALSSSDIRLKENIKATEVESALDVLDKIVMHSFDWTDSGKHQSIGFVADEMEEVDENFTFGGGYEEDGSMNVKGIDTFYLVGYVVKAIQELREMVEEIKR